MPCDFVISDIQWANADDLLCPIHDATGSTCASRTPSGARWSARLPPSIPSLHVDPRCPKRSVTCSSLTPALCSELTLRGRRCATHRAASRTGSAGVWREPSAPLHPADESRVPEARHNQSHWLRRAANPNPSTKPGQVQTRPFWVPPNGAQEGRWRIEKVTMVEVKEVLRLWLKGVPMKRIALQRGVDPKTIRRQIELAEECGLRRKAGEAALTEELLVSVAEKLRPAVSHAKGDGWQRCEEQRAFIRGHLGPSGQADEDPEAPPAKGSAGQLPVVVALCGERAWLRTPGRNRARGGLWSWRGVSARHRLGGLDRSRPAGSAPPFQGLDLHLGF